MQKAQLIIVASIAAVAFIFAAALAAVAGAESSSLASTLLLGLVFLSFGLSGVGAVGFAVVLHRRETARAARRAARRALLVAQHSYS